MKELLKPDITKDITSRFPRSILSASRAEFGNPEENPAAKDSPLKLEVKEGTIPTDLQGHLFFIGANGSIDSPQGDADADEATVFPSRDGTTPLYNGDGMVYRVDFDNLQEGVFLSARLVKPPCYYADVATAKCPDYRSLKFYNLGIARISRLGSRNQLNTAFLPMKFQGENRDRLLVTWDVGRPYEIDPKTLETVTPVGGNDEWEEVSKLGTSMGQPPQVFKIVQTSAHPCFDPYTSEMFTVNIGRSPANVFSQLVPIPYLLKELIDWIKNGGKVTPSPEDDGELKQPDKSGEFFLGFAWRNLVKICHILMVFLRAIWEIFTGNFVYLMQWDGAGKLKKWKVHYNGCPLKIEQSIHQMGVTKDYVVLVDTAFKLSIEELLPSLSNIENAEKIEKIIRNWFDKPQLPNTRVYIINRRDLKPEKDSVDAKKAMVPGEAAHFLVDYRNPGDRITLHVSHVCAWDAAEWLSEFDYDENEAGEKLGRLYGAIAGPMDISRLGCHEIDGKTGTLIENQQHTVMDVNYTWGPALYAYRNFPHPETLENIYWSCLGCWSELKTPHMVHLYRDYPHRQIGLELLDEITAQGRNSNLLRVQIKPRESVKAGENRLSIADVYQFPENRWAISPQFIPRSDRGSSTDGYIACIVHHGDGSDPTNGNELWIFDAADLKSGPKCKLWHPDFNVGFTIHTTWLAHIETRNSSYHVNSHDDYQHLIDKQSSTYRTLIQTLFDNWVYPQREPKSELDCQMPREPGMKKP